ncbi:DNA polymerase III subunit delta' [Listeria grayi]|uniref:DNA polymerase III, delta' subunit n=1 Tax=Listeria grayi DSM 20601 TaxID=525367 RepID=D7UUR2_LISGR|nr:DNA polymerase III, delta' subunit [Listeria grayi DSM 20601]
MGRQTEWMDKQPIAMKLFSQSIQENRLSHGYLLEGPSGTGKKEIALWLSQAIFCLQPKPEELACGECENCIRIKSGNHPDIHTIVPDGASIKIEQVRQLKQELSRRGMESNQKIVIIEQADKMTVQSANSLLKFIEEPDGGMLLLFLTDRPQQILPTIASRLQPVSFKALKHQDLVAQMTASGIPQQKARIYASLTGSTEQAQEWEAEDWFAEARNVVVKLYEGIHHQGVSPLILIQETWMTTLKDKEKTALGLELLILLYRDRLHLALQEDYEPVCIAQIDMLKKDAMQHSLSETSTDIQLILTQKSKLDSNMNVQLLMEQLVLELQGR